MIPDVSVLMPVRDAAATLGIALRSVLRSRGVRLEVVCVEHGSRDATPEILARFVARDPRVRCVSAPTTIDLGGALEVGRGACRASVVARMDADDVMHPERLAADLAWLRSRPVAAVACRVKPTRGRGVTARIPPGLVGYVSWQNAALSAAEHARELWIEQPLCHPATTFTADALAAVGGWPSGPPSVPEDYELFLRLVGAGLAIEKREAVHHAWRIHAGTGTRWTRDALAATKARHLVAHFALADRPLVICGAGKEGRRIARALAAHGVAATAFVDVAADKIGRTRRGAPVLAASELPALHARHRDLFALGAVGTSGARPVVRAAMIEAGLVEGEGFVMVA